MRYDNYFGSEKEMYAQMLGQNLSLIDYLSGVLLVLSGVFDFDVFSREFKKV